MFKKYRINDDPKAIDGKTITCLVCGMTSYNPNDVKDKYCGNCHKFLED